MKLFKVKFQTSKTSNIFYAFVIAGKKYYCYDDENK